MQFSAVCHQAVSMQVCERERTHTDRQRSAIQLKPSAVHDSVLWTKIVKKQYASRTPRASNLHLIKASGLWSEPALIQLPVLRRTDRMRDWWKNDETGSINGSRRIWHERDSNRLQHTSCQSIYRINDVCQLIKAHTEKSTLVKDIQRHYRGGGVNQQ